MYKASDFGSHVIRSSQLGGQPSCKRGAIFRDNRWIWGSPQSSCIMPSYKLYYMFICALRISILFAYVWVSSSWGHITTVPDCSSVTLTNILPHWNADSGFDITPCHSIQISTGLTCHCVLVWNITLSVKTISLMSWVSSNKKFIPDHPHMKYTYYFNVIMVAFNEELGRKCTVPSKSQTCESNVYPLYTAE